VALTGHAFDLNKKFETDVENWTYEDTDELASLQIGGLPTAAPVHFHNRR